MKDPRKRSDFIQYLVEKMIESPFGFANELVDAFDHLEEGLDVQHRAIMIAGHTLRLERKTSTALFEMVKGAQQSLAEYENTIDKLTVENAELEEENAELEAALNVACRMVDALQRFSGASLLYVN